MFTRRQRTFQNPGEQRFLSLAVVETDDSEYLLLRREAGTFRELFAVRAQSAVPVDLFAEFSTALHCFERRCRDLQRCGWRHVAEVA